MVTDIKKERREWAALFNSTRNFNSNSMRAIKDRDDLDIAEHSMNEMTKPIRHAKGMESSVNKVVVYRVEGFGSIHEQDIILESRVGIDVFIEVCI